MYLIIFKSKQVQPASLLKNLISAGMILLSSR
jgi:hypothetical protein